MSNAATLLAALNAHLEARLADGYDEYSEGDQRFKALSIAELRAWRKELMAELAAAEHGGLSLGSVIPAEG